VSVTNTATRTTANDWTGDVVRELRQKAKLTNEQFAGRLRVSVRTVLRWQAGTERPSPLAREKLESLALEVAA
jgi:DNA-binding transcriptional regulator YiaG